LITVSIGLVFVPLEAPLFTFPLEVSYLVLLLVVFNMQLYIEQLLFKIDYLVLAWKL